MDRAARRGLRTCVGCLRTAPKGEMLRLVATADGGVCPDPTGRTTGRGGYLHPRRDCWQRFAVGKPYVRSLRRTVGRVRRLSLIEELEKVAGGKVRGTA